MLASAANVFWAVVLATLGILLALARAFFEAATLTFVLANNAALVHACLVVATLVIARYFPLTHVATRWSSRPTGLEHPSPEPTPEKPAGAARTSHQQSSLASLGCPYLGGRQCKDRPSRRLRRTSRDLVQTDVIKISCVPVVEPTDLLSRIAPSLVVLRESPGECLDGFLSQDFGFCPERPLARLPINCAHALWEDVGKVLPTMNASGDYSALSNLPLLDAEAAALPDAHLKRAATLLGVMVHSWSNLGPGFQELPVAIKVPWEHVSKRLGRPLATMTSQDYFMQNLCWRPEVDQDQAFSDENLLRDTEVSMKAFGQGNELHYIRHNFGMDWACRQLPLDMANTQQAVLDGNETNLELGLRRVHCHIHKLTSMFSAINPHPAAKNACCPVIWSRTIGRMTAPAYEGEYSLNGLQNSTFHIIDIFLGRSEYGTYLGQLALAERDGWLPSPHLQFFAALEKVSVRDYVLKHGSRRVRRLYNQVLDAWTGPGENSWMNKHRLKMADFLELGMKTARSQFIVGISDWSEARAWEHIDNQHIDAIRERFDSLCIRESWYTPVLVRCVEDIGSNNSRVVFDVVDAGLCFSPGDRVKVLPMNSPEQVLRSLEALGAPGSMEVLLTQEWLNFVSRLGMREALEFGSLQFYKFMQYATLRPLTPAMASGLITVLEAESPSLLDLAEKGSELKGFEFWDFVMLCMRFTTKTYCELKCSLKDHIAEILPPLEPRQYSISDGHIQDGQLTAMEIIVGQLWYDSEIAEGLCQEIRADRGEDGVEMAEQDNFEISDDRESFGQDTDSDWDTGCPMQNRGSLIFNLGFTGCETASLRRSSYGNGQQFEDAEKFRLALNAVVRTRFQISSLPERSTVALAGGRMGVCSTYLRHFAVGRAVRIQVEPAEHFHMPADVSCPVVMFGLGTGVTPYRSFVQRGSGDRELWLFWGTRSKDDLFLWQTEWAPRVLAGHLHVRLALSQNIAALGQKDWPDSPTADEVSVRWGELTAGKKDPGRLDVLLKVPEIQKSLASLVQRGAVFYVCGPPDLGVLVKECLVSALEACLGLSRCQAWRIYIDLVADGRFRADLFASTVHAEHRHRQPITRSAVAKHCHATDCWTILDGHVFDLTHFLLQHPGGPKILLDKAGRDCTADFERTHGLSNVRVTGMFKPYYLGPLKTPVLERDTAKRKGVIGALLKLLDQLLEVSNASCIDWNRYTGSKLSCFTKADDSSFFRDLETYRRFTKVSVPIVIRAVGHAFDFVEGAATSARSRANTVEDSISDQAMSKRVSVPWAHVLQRAKDMAEGLGRHPEPQTMEELSRAMKAGQSWISAARDEATQLLADVEESVLDTSAVMRRLRGMLQRLTIPPTFAKGLDE